MSGRVQLVLDALASAGFRPHQSSNGWSARCPSHQDQVPSLSVSEGWDGRVLLHCHAGCEINAIVRALGLTVSDLFPITTNVPIRRWGIKDADGRLVAFHVRRDRPEGKRLHWERSDGQPGLNGIRAINLPLYGSELVHEWASKGEPIVLVEGEPAADVLRAHNIKAVSTVCGASTCPSASVLEILRARHIVLWPDSDQVGRQHMQKVATRLSGVAASVRVLTCKDAPQHGDAVDYFSAGGTADELRRMLAEAPLAAVAEITDGMTGEPESTNNAKPIVTTKPEARPAARQGRALEWKDDEPAANPVDGAALLDEVERTATRFVAVPPGASVAIALWVVLTYLVNAVEVLPRLLVSSPTRACGKTRLLALLGALVRRPLAISSGSAPALFRIIEAAQPTLLLDEMDNARLSENEELRAVLNSGHTQATAGVLRVVGEPLEPALFSTWAAIAFAAIGRLPDTVASRSVEVPMRRRAPGERVERLRESRIRAELQPLRARLARWCRDNAERVGSADPAVPEGLGDREADNWRPLLAIADAAGGMWPERARQAAKEMSGVSVDMEGSAGEQLLADLRTAFEGAGTEHLTSETLVKALVEMDERPWSEWRQGKPLTKNGLARLLKPYGVRTRNLRLSGGKVAKGYARGDFDDAWDRYLPNQSISNRYNATEPGNTGRTDVLPSATDSQCSGCENATPTSDDAACSVVADGKPRFEGADPAEDPWADRDSLTMGEQLRAEFRQQETGSC